MSIIGFAQLSYQGRLTDAPELRTLDSGTTVCKFTVAVNRRLPNGEEKTSYIPTTVFGRQGQICGEYLTKGRSVYVTGEFETNKYTDRTGTARTGFGCVARDVIFGSGGRTEESDRTPEEHLPSRDSRDKHRRAREYIKGSRR